MLFFSAITGYLYPYRRLLMEISELGTWEWVIGLSSNVILHMLKSGIFRLALGQADVGPWIYSS